MPKGAKRTKGGKAKSKKTKKVGTNDHRDNQGRRERFIKEQHLAVIQASLIEGVPDADIIEAAVKEFKISERQAYRDLRTVYKRWEKAGEELKAQNISKRSFALAILRRHHLYNQALADRKYRDALEAEVDRCKLENLYPDKSIKVDGIPKTDVQINQVNILKDMLDASDSKRLSNIFGILRQAGALSEEALSGDVAAKVDEVHSEPSNGQATSVPSAQQP